ncbi:S-methyl-5-thioribose-1-phosphate isomerase [Fictibacillus sp. Mic-4]|uniref:S-methyl-5-thioribose-1-phosphate isomerase n=1 Tax=Fictibacillus sp. Mic-4 TaxID=3132826 RepID=UPI003CF2C09A
MTTVKEIRSIEWKDDHLYLLDQTVLPLETRFLEVGTIEEVWDAIKKLKVRGAPAIGVAAGYGLYLGVKEAPEESFAAFYNKFQEKKEYLASSRPTAVNLFWVLNRLDKLVQNNRNESPAQLKELILTEAIRIHEEDEEVCRAIGEHGLPLLKEGMGILTHCNAGGIATARYGTALSPIYLAHEAGMKLKVYADETRPLLQGARLTAWELQQAGIDVTLITDNMAAYVMKKGFIDAVIVGCDRVAANGDTANKIGTYGVAVLAREHNIPFYVAAPLSTIDPGTACGDEIEIEERLAEEVTEGFGRRTAPYGVKVMNPAFDVTPNEYITAFITEKGIVKPDYKENLKKLFTLA